MAFTFKIKKRCRFCGTVLREDGTCPNEKCPRYVPAPKPVEPKPETPSEGTATPSEGNNTPAVEAPSTGEPVPSDGKSATNAETEPTP